MAFDNNFDWQDSGDLNRWWIVHVIALNTAF